jgi:hypothetical protein
MSMLSSRWTYLVKYILGPLWMVLIGLVVGTVVFSLRDSRGAAGDPPPWFAPWIFVGVGLVACVGILRFAIPLKRVELRDGRLYVSNYRREWEIAPNDILSVRQSRWVNSRPIRVQLRYDVEGLGSRFMFIPPSRARLKFWREDPQVEELRRFAETVQTTPKA